MYLRGNSLRLTVVRVEEVEAEDVGINAGSAACADSSCLSFISAASPTRCRALSLSASRPSCPDLEFVPLLAPGGGVWCFSVCCCCCCCCCCVSCCRCCCCCRTYRSYCCSAACSAVNAALQTSEISCSPLASPHFIISHLLHVVGFGRYGIAALSALVFELSSSRAPFGILNWNRRWQCSNPSRWTPSR